LLSELGKYYLLLGEDVLEGSLEVDELLLGVGFDGFGGEEVVNVFALEPAQVQLLELVMADFRVGFPVDDPE
jgi:hypothetical protein